jgi:hypothetical protein
VEDVVGVKHEYDVVVEFGPYAQLLMEVVVPDSFGVRILVVFTQECSLLCVGGERPRDVGLC